MSTKFREMNKTIRKFNEAYKLQQLDESMKSWENDTNVFETVLEIFKIENNGRAFKFVDIWKFLFDSQKWKEVFGNKKNLWFENNQKYEISCTTLSDVRFRFDLNQDDEFGLEEIVWLIGKDNTKR